MNTTIVRCLAVVFIANSHLERLYPVPQLAADGLLGNSLFFLLSGLGLELGARARKGKSETFANWYGRRLARIYPALWIVVVGFVVLGQGAWRTWGPADYASALAWPTAYGFLAQIVPFYAIYYVLMRRRDGRVYVAGVAGLAVSYLLVAAFVYDLHVLSVLFHAQTMLLGGWLASRAESLGQTPKRDVAVLGLTLAAYISIKLAMSLGRVPTHIAPLHLLAVPIVVCLVSLGNSARAIKSILGRPWLARPVTLMATLTLEIYLVHGFVYENPWVESLQFPLNLAAFWGLTVALAWLVGRASHWDKAAARLRGVGVVVTQG